MSALMRQVTVILAYLAMVTVNSLANTLPINGRTTGEISNQYEVLFQPIPLTFAIWGVIYFGLGVYVIYQALPAQRDDRLVRSLDLPFVLSCAFNIAWLLVWHHDLIPVSLVVILALTSTLVVLYLRIDPERETAPVGRRFVLHHAFSVYLAWLVIATLANLAITLESLGWTESPTLDQVGYVVAALVALSAAGLVALPRADIAWLLATIWAFIGLALAHLGEPLLAAVAWVGVAGLLVMLVISVVRRVRSRP